MKRHAQIEDPIVSATLYLSTLLVKPKTYICEQQYGQNKCLCISRGRNQRLRKGALKNTHDNKQAWDSTKNYYKANFQPFV
mmetsp:Transcript_9092/g.10590  ORF Transcript_9092/g.10590 Transcript_9092/m.10590 type:complete len:81 (-) Transcript_9092:92-334(-)